MILAHGLNITILTHDDIPNHHIYACMPLYNATSSILHAQNDDIATAMTWSSLWLIETVTLLTPALCAAASASPC